MFYDLETGKTFSFTETLNFSIRSGSRLETGGSV
jgi:hypothetical protein